MTHPVPDSVVRAAQLLGVLLEGRAGEQLAAYLDLLLQTNETFNLTAITDLGAAWSKHALDSLTIAPSLAALPAGSEVVDVGSGGGLPGIPLAIALPALRFTLLEATQKKANFLAEAARELGLTNVRVEQSRAESFGQGAGRERFVAATSRAVSRLPVLLELTLPLVQSGGVSIAIKGAQAELEIAEAERALSLLHGQVEVLQRTATGAVVVVRKLAPTPRRYPRRPGEPKRSPL